MTNILNKIIPLDGTRIKTEECCNGCVEIALILNNAKNGRKCFRSSEMKNVDMDNQLTPA